MTAWLDLYYEGGAPRGNALMARATMIVAAEVRDFRTACTGRSDDLTPLPPNAWGWIGMYPKTGVVMAKSEKPRSMNDSERAVGVTMLADAPSAERSRHDPLEEQIRMRAYELYLERGAEPNDDLGNWLQAEREYRGQSRDERSSSEASHDWAQ